MPGREPLPLLSGREDGREPLAAVLHCSCERPLPHSRPERKGVARTYCRRCDLPVPLTLLPS